MSYHSYTQHIHILKPILRKTKRKHKTGGLLTKIYSASPSSYANIIHFIIYFYVEYVLQYVTYVWLVYLGFGAVITVFFIRDQYLDGHFVCWFYIMFREVNIVRVLLFIWQLK